MKWLLAVALALFASSVSAAPIVTNGSFGAGNVGFGSDYVFTPDGPAVDDLWDAGLYAIDDNAIGRHPYWVTQGDHTGDGAMMLVNGRTDGVSTVWRQTVNVEAGHSYQFSAWGMNLCCDWAAIGQQAPQDEFQGPDLEFWIDGLFAGLFSTDGPGVWLQGAQYFTAGAATAVLEIRNAQTIYRGNDFALDDIELIDTAQAPEPGSMVLLGTSLVWLAGLMRKRKVQR